LLVLCLAAPTAGDIGSCGQKIAELDPEAFFADKSVIDCQKCIKCKLAGATCNKACSNKGVKTFDENCFPLVHDGEVCLNALRAASCSEYQSYVDDVAPTVPTECNFCPLATKPAAGTGGSK
jgi:hypothetical protein